MTAEDIRHYFTAEKQESLVFLGIGLLACILAAYGLFTWKTRFWQGAAIPLVLVGLIQLVVGGTVWLRSDHDIARVTDQLQREPEALRTQELPRMETVNRNFDLYRNVELLLAAAGLILLLLALAMKAEFWKGLGAFLLLQSALMLAADYFAERRADRYTEKLQSHIDRMP